MIAAVCIDVYSNETAWMKMNSAGWRDLSGFWSRNTTSLLLGVTVLPNLSKPLTAIPDQLSRNFSGYGYAASLYYTRFSVKLVVKCMPYHQEIQHKNH